MKKKIILYSIILLVSYFVSGFFIGDGNVFSNLFKQNTDSTKTTVLKTDTLQSVKHTKTQDLGINIGGVAIKGDSLSVHTVAYGDNFNSLLRKHFNDIPNIVTQKAIEFFFPIKELKARSAYYISYKKGKAHAFHIIRDEKLVSINNLLTVGSSSLPVKESTQCVSGSLNGSLWNEFSKNDYPTALAIEMGNIFEHQIDFYHLQNGDAYKIYFEQKRIGNANPSIKQVKYAEITHKGKLYTGMYFDSEEGKGFYNEEGKSLKTAFLRSPLEFGRLSSGFNPRRYHPVLKRVKAHKGTDYAAPRGTPIRAVGNGKVTRASYTSGNGNYVKIRHNSSVETQYLHMSKFANGIKPGASVLKGQTIGYVGSTGLATGPHVCFRYWLNGKQVNHLAIKQEPQEPIKESEVDAFNTQLNKLKVEMDLINKKI